MAARLTGILSLMQSKSRSVLPFGDRDRQTSQDTTDSHIGDESGDDLRREDRDGGTHTDAREPVDGQDTTRSKRGTVLDIPNDTSRDMNEARPPNKDSSTGMDNLGYHAHDGDSGIAVNASNDTQSSTATPDSENSTAGKDGNQQVYISSPLPNL